MSETKSEKKRSHKKKPTLGEIFAERLNSLRARKKLTQSEVAEKANVSVSYVSMLERGQRSPPLETIEALAKALGVPAVSFFT